MQKIALHLSFSKQLKMTDSPIHKFNETSYLALTRGLYRGLYLPTENKVNNVPGGFFQAWDCRIAATLRYSHIKTGHRTANGQNRNDIIVWRHFLSNVQQRIPCKLFQQFLALKLIWKHFYVTYSKIQVKNQTFESFLILYIIVFLLWNKPCRLQRVLRTRCWFFDGILWA